jgi:Tfp pilus assembly protein PilO
VGQLTQLEDAQRQLDNQYSRQKDQLMGQDGTQEDLRSLENSYRTNRIQLMKARADLEREYRKQIRKTGIKRGLTAAIIQGVRRW